MNKKTERLENQLRLFHEIVENMAEGVFLIRARDGVIIYANPAMERIFGYASRELAGKHISAVNAPTDKRPEEIAQEIIQSLKDNGVWRGEVKNLKKDGTAFWCHANVSTIEHLQHGNVWVSVNQDITERKRAEETIKRRNEELSLLNTINQAANRGDNLKSILRLLARETTRIFKSVGITIHLLSPDRQRLVMQDPFLSPGMVEGIEKLIGISIPRIEHDLQAAHPYRRVLESGKPQVVYGSKGIQEIMAAYLVSIPVKDKLRARLQRLIPAIVKMLGCQSILIVPLISEGRIIGVVDMGKREPFTDEDVKWLETIAGQLTVVIERKRAEEALRESEIKYRTLVETSPDAIALTDLQGKVLMCNDQAALMQGLKGAEDLIGRNVFSMLAPMSHEMKRAVDNTDKILSEETSKGLKYNVVRQDGSPYTVEVSASIVKNTQGNPQGFITISRDITDRDQMENALRESEARYRAIVEDQTELICRFLPDGKLTFVNDAYCRYFGIKRDDIVGRSFMPFIPAEDRDIVSKAVSDLSPVSPVAMTEHRVISPNGELRWQQWANRAIFDETGQVRELQAVGRDITGRKQAEDELQHSETRFRTMFLHAPIGIELYNAQGLLIDANPVCLEMFGVNHVGMVKGFNLFEDPNVPADAKKRLLNGESVRYEMVFDFEAVKKHALYETTKSGQSHIECFITPWDVGEEDQKGFLVHVSDITERKRIEDALKQSEAHYRLLADHMTDTVWLMDMNLKTTYISPSVEKTRGYTLEELQQLPLDQHITPASLQLVMEVLSEEMPKVMADPTYSPTLTLELEFYRKDGSTFWGENKLNIIRDENGNPVSILGEGSDITERKRAEEKLREANKHLEEQFSEIKILQDYLHEQATHDPLTGLYNRLYLYTTMERELARAKRENSPISVMMIDIDHFKDFNDTYGHQAGDEILKALGRLLRSSVRLGDFACRYGGEEFIIIMPGAYELDAERRAEAIRHDFNNLCINYGGGELSTTISIGVAFYPQHGDDVNEIVKAADAALYEAKQAGRNCVHVWKSV